MNSDLLKAVKHYKANSEYTCVLCKNDIIITSAESGIKPLIKWVKSSDNYKDFSAADKIVGKAAAFLYVILGVKEVYAEVMSEKAVSAFDRYNIEYSYNTLTNEIINRNGTDICPMEKAVQDTDDPNEAFKVLQKKISNM